MKWYIFIIVLCFLSLQTQAQNTSVDIQFSAEAELNYMGYNLNFIELTRINNHRIELGVNYNMSDGFSDNAVVGLKVAYGYNILKNEKWVFSAGLDYAVQKPLPHLHIQGVYYTNVLEYSISSHVAVRTKIGYGLGLERAKINSVIYRNQNESGLFSLGCVYTL